MTDDLHSHQPLCQLLLEHELHFIMTCREESHQALYQEVELLSRLEGAIHGMTVRHWNGRYHELRTYRWVEQDFGEPLGLSSGRRLSRAVPVRARADALAVNWCEITIEREDTGKPLYHNAWITSHELSEKTVAEVAAAGRAHWKVENENFNVLKNHGYHFEHNYGHGKQHLSAVLLMLLLRLSSFTPCWICLVHSIRPSARSWALAAPSSTTSS